MRRVRILVVGKLKTLHWQKAIAHYAVRLARAVDLEESVAKDADPALPASERRMQEAASLVKLLKPRDWPICLDERGTMSDSQAFTGLLGRVHDDGRVPCFIVGGAYGLGEAVLALAEHRLSLGPMTFTHELARVILYEQLYRAEQIRLGTGYHHCS